MNKNEIKAALQCCSAVGFETSCSDCPYCYRCNDLSKDALNIITEQEKEIEQLTRECNKTAKEILQRLYDKCYEVQGLREGYAHITPLDILILAKDYGVEVEE